MRGAAAHRVRAATESGPIATAGRRAAGDPASMLRGGCAALG